MRPVPIPDELMWEGSVRKVIAGPEGDLIGDIRPVETIIDQVDGALRFCVLVKLDEGDLERFAEDGRFWLTWYGNHLHPFAVTMMGGDDDDA